MSNINLLPWREGEKRRKKQCFFIVFVSSCLLLLLFCYFVSIYIDFKIEAQNKRNQFLNAELLILDKQIAEVERIKKEKYELLRHISLIQRLEKKRNAATRLFNSLPDITPSGVYLTSVDFSHEQIKITGLADSNEEVSHMLRNVEKSKWLTDVSLPSIISEPTKPINLSKFSMNFIMLSEQKEVQ